MFRTQLTPAEKALKEAQKAQKRAERKAEADRLNRIREEARKERFEAMPSFVVREVREVTVKAENMQDAISIAATAFKEGQDDEGSIKWAPFGIEGDTIDKIRVVNVKATQVDE